MFNSTKVRCDLYEIPSIIATNYHDILLFTYKFCNIRHNSLIRPSPRCEEKAIKPFRGWFPFRLKVSTDKGKKENTKKKSIYQKRSSSSEIIIIPI